MKKFFLTLFLLFVVLIIALAVFISPILSTGIEEGVNRFGPEVLKVPVSLEEVNLSVYSGDAAVKGLVLGNPKGFKSDYSIKLGEARVDIDITSVTSDTIVVKEVVIDGPMINYETAFSKTNIGTILDGLKGEPTSGTTTPEAPAEPADTGDAPAIKVVVENFVVKNGKVQLSLSQLGGQGIAVPLPSIHLKDIGKSSGGATPQEVLEQIFVELNKSLASVGGASSQSIESIGNSVKDAGDAVKKEADSIIDGVKGLFK